MRKAAIIILAALLLSAIGCGAKPDDPNAVFIDPNAARGGEYGELYFEADGVRFGIFDETATVLSALPAYRSTSESESCAFENSADVYYYYADYQIRANEIDGVSRITEITIKSDSVKTPQGLYIGMPEEDAKKAFPALFDADWNLVDGTALLSVTIVEGKIAWIVYLPAEQED